MEYMCILVEIDWRPACRWVFVREGFEIGASRFGIGPSELLAAGSRESCGISSDERGYDST
jgi:hypothetical protein